MPLNKQNTHERCQDFIISVEILCNQNGYYYKLPNSTELKIS